MVSDRPVHGFEPGMPSDTMNDGRSGNIRFIQCRQLIDEGRLSKYERYPYSKLTSRPGCFLGGGSLPGERTLSANGTLPWCSYICDAPLPFLNTAHEELL